MVHHKHHSNKNVPRLTPLLAAGAIVVSSILTPIAANADELQKKIDAIEQKKAKNQNISSQLGKKADTVEGQIDQLVRQISAIQSQIDINTDRQNDLEQKIKEAQAELDEQKEMLSANIRSMYIESDISPLEMIASSDNLSDFVDKQEYRDRIKDNISDAMDEIEELKKRLDEQKQEVARILDEQKALRGNLTKKNNEADAKLAAINEDKSSFDKRIQNQTAEISALRAQQRAANLAAFGGGGQVVSSGSGGGGYPYNNVPYPCWGGGGCADPWGLYKRECVSYTAFKVQQAGKRMPYFGGRGNAYEWPDTAQSYGIGTGSKPRAKSVAISFAGPYGHAMWVEAVLPDGRIHVSEYNFYINGTYSERIISPAGLAFIYF